MNAPVGTGDGTPQVVGTTPVAGTPAAKLNFAQGGLLTASAGATPPADGTAAPLVPIEAPQAFEPTRNEYKFFNRAPTERICLPTYCNRLKEPEKFAIATKGKKILDAWTAAGGTAQTDDALPGPIDGKQFVDFYTVQPIFIQKLNAGVILPPDVSQIADLTARDADVLKALNFNSDIPKVCWLQYWTYMCSRGMPPLDKEYKSNKRKTIF